MGFLGMFAACATGQLPGKQQYQCQLDNQAEIIA
jgi:hypothetical protein